ncbi:MAG: hypothetical protein ACFB2W_00790 [Leptolyngbyaceae cyanobacterium]
MTEDFEKTATLAGDQQRQQVNGVIRGLQQTIQTSSSEVERQNARLMLETLGASAD